MEFAAYQVERWTAYRRNVIYRADIGVIINRDDLLAP